MESASPTTPRPDEARDIRIRNQAALISVAVSILLLGVKFVGYAMTGSTAVLSDALESIINVFAAAGAAAAIRFSAKPADRNHPYGHGKIEFVSAAFEGGLIAFAAVLLIYEAVQSLLSGVAIRQLNLGIGVVLGAGLANALLGVFLLRIGRKHRSPALVADGHHVLSDFWTSLGVGLGLIAVLWTGIVWLDPLIAAAVAIKLAITGVRLVREALGGLMDEEDPTVVEELVAVMEQEAEVGIIRIHSLRAIRSGSFHHVDAHLVVPEFWSVERAHGETERYARSVIDRYAFDGEIEFHTDPCRQIYCSGCRVEACPVRAEPFVSRPPLTVEEAVRKDAPTREVARQQWQDTRQTAS